MTTRIDSDGQGIVRVIYEGPDGESPSTNDQTYDLNQDSGMLVFLMRTGFAGKIQAALVELGGKGIESSSSNSSSSAPSETDSLTDFLVKVLRELNVSASLPHRDRIINSNAYPYIAWLMRNKHSIRID